MRRREGGKRGSREVRGPQVPLYLESPEAEYIPTYLPSTCSPLTLSLLSSLHLSLTLAPDRFPPPTSHPRNLPRRSSPRKLYRWKSMMHAIEQQRGPISDLLHLADDARRDVAVVLFFSFFFFFLSFFSLSLLCRRIANAVDPVEFILVFSSSFSQFVLLVLGRSSNLRKRFQACVIQIWNSSFSTSISF